MDNVYVGGTSAASVGQLTIYLTVAINCVPLRLMCALQ